MGSSNLSSLFLRYTLKLYESVYHWRQEVRYMVSLFQDFCWMKESVLHCVVVAGGMQCQHASLQSSTRDRCLPWKLAETIVSIYLWKLVAAHNDLLRNALYRGFLETKELPLPWYAMLATGPKGFKTCVANSTVDYSN